MRQTWKACLLAAAFVLTALSASAQTPEKTSTTAQQKAAYVKALKQTKTASQEQVKIEKIHKQTATASIRRSSPCRKPVAHVNVATGEVTVLNKNTHKKN